MEHRTRLHGLETHLHNPATQRSGARIIPRTLNIRDVFCVIVRGQPLLRNPVFHICILNMWIILVISSMANMWNAVNTVLSTSKYSVSNMIMHQQIIF